MVTLGVRDRVVANFGGAENRPFRYPSGRNWEFKDEIEIESVDRSSHDEELWEYDSFSSEPLDDLCCSEEHITRC